MFINTSIDHAVEDEECPHEHVSLHHMESILVIEASRRGMAIVDFQGLFRFGCQGRISTTVDHGIVLRNKVRAEREVVESLQRIDETVSRGCKEGSDFLRIPHIGTERVGVPGADAQVHAHVLQHRQSDAFRSPRCSMAS